MNNFQGKYLKFIVVQLRKKRWKIIDASKPKLEIHEEILKAFSKKLGL